MLNYSYHSHQFGEIEWQTDKTIIENASILSDNMTVN